MQNRILKRLKGHWVREFLYFLLKENSYIRYVNNMMHTTWTNEMSLSEYIIDAFAWGDDDSIFWDILNHKWHKFISEKKDLKCKRRNKCKIYG